MSGYSRGQLFAAKIALVVVAAVVVGSQAAEKPDELLPGIVVVLAGLGAIVVAYEALSRGIALVLAQIGRGNKTAGQISNTESVAPPSSPGPSDGMRLRHILATFLGYLAGQAVVWLVAVVVVAARLGTGADEDAITRGMRPLLPAVLPVSVLAGGLGALWVLSGWGKRLGPRNFVDTLALRSGARRQLGRGALAGATLGLISLVLMPYIPYSPSSPDLMDEFLSAPGPARWSWVLSAVILAPPVEELVFRGVLLGGLARIWNLRAAAVISAVTFWAMHAPEWLRYWPAAVAIGLMTLIVTVLRIRTRALGPSIAAHSAYNLLMASVVLGSQPDGLLPRSDGPKWARLAPGLPSRSDHPESRLKPGMDIGLRDKRAPVTGSTAGIGLATARALLADGAVCSARASATTGVVIRVDGGVVRSII